MIPQLGFGTWQAPLDVTKEVVLAALNTGYKHIDCAFVYENEKAIGEAFGEFFKTHDRSEYWITTKLWNTNHRPENVRPQLLAQLKDLQLDYVDLYLIHWPCHFKHGSELIPMDQTNKVILETGYSLIDTYRAMENLVDNKLTKHIGVSNFNVAMLNDIISGAKILPLCNQIESHPFYQNNDLIKYCLSIGMHVTAYSPLGGFYHGVSGLEKLQKDKKLQEISQSKQISISQIILKWQLQRFDSKYYNIIPKSQNIDRIKANTQLNFNLEAEHMEYINSLNKNEKCCDPMVFWKLPLFD